MPTTNHALSLDDGTSVALVVDDRSQLRQIRITAPKGRALSSSTVHALPVGRMLAMVTGPRHRPSLRLTIPDTNRYPDSFYQELGDAYLWVRSNSARAAEVLAEANGVPPSTVHRWVREARRRGVLMAGERG